MRKTPQTPPAIRSGPPSGSRSLVWICGMIGLGVLGLLIGVGMVWLASPSGVSGVRPRYSPSQADLAIAVADVPLKNDLPGAHDEECPADHSSQPMISGADPAAGVVAALAAGGYAPAAEQATALADTENRLQCLLPIVAGWVEVQPVEAAHFAQSLPVGVERKEILTAVMAGWSAHDAAAAEAWLDKLASGADCDGAFAIIATRTSDEPQIALSWAARITDAGSRWETIRSIVQGWAMTDESAARVQVDKIPGLTAGQRFQLLNRTSQRTALLD